MVSAEHLFLEINGTPILRDVSFSLPQGRVLGIVGESGSGKSMTALSLMRLLPRGATSRGRLSLGDTDLSALSEPQMCGLRGRRIAMIFQEPMTALNPVQSIGDQVAEALIIHGMAGRSEARAAAKDRLARVGLAPDRFPLSRYPHELSGGQRQRVCIALAIALRPEVLIADEPTTALDVTTQARILDLLRDLVATEGMAMILISHDLAVVAQMANQIAVMKSGEIVEHGAAADVLAHRRHPYTRALFAASSHAPERTSEGGGPPLLEVRDVVRSYAGRRSGLFGPRERLIAVDGVRFTLKAGESLGLVGESGCGKSTLSRAILGLDPVDHGEIRLAGTPVGPDMAPELRQRMQVVFQDPYGSFNPRHRVAKLLAEPWHLTGQPKDASERLVTALEEVGLSASDLEKFPHEFSGGQRQRLAIARALIARPDLIVLDEAVSALDVSVRATVLDLLVALQRRHGLSYLFISHDLTVVRAVTDRVLVMQAGQVVESGPTQQVFATPHHAYTRQLIDAAPVLPPTEKGSHGATL